MKGKLFSALLLSGLLLQVSGAFAAELKIGFVNTAKILTEAPQAEDANRRLQREFAPREKGLSDAQKSLRSLEQQLTRDGDTMSESKRRQLERDVIAQRRELKRSSDEFREDVNLRRNEELGKFQRDVIEVINRLAREQNFDLILNDAAAIYASDQVDITSQVLSRLGGKGK
ncbi:MAG: OmpH family outer membrane protein [Gammaproteobacteria bacterium]|nr:OmpH family outer membrane protein [Gammaproteobacteria bacterium]